MCWNLVLKSPVFIPYRTNMLTKFGANLVSLISGQARPSRPVNIMNISPNLPGSQKHGVYHIFWGVYTITIGWTWYTTRHVWLNLVNKCKYTPCYWDSACSVIWPVVFYVLGQTETSFQTEASFQPFSSKWYRTDFFRLYWFSCHISG